MNFGLNNYSVQRWNGTSFSSDIPSFEVNISNQKVPMRSLLVLEETVSGVLQSKKPLKMKMEAKNGRDGKVKFVQFNKDPNHQWFAIKRPRKLQDVENALKAYKNNLRMAEKLRDHPNFMKVHGYVVKERKGVEKPYLILECLEGVDLQRCYLATIPLYKKKILINQLKSALLHLFDLRILPLDLGLWNIIVSREDLKLKIIDFDHWRSYDDTFKVEDPFGLLSREDKSSPQEIGEYLYNIAGALMRNLVMECKYPDPGTLELNSRESFEQELEKLISPLSEN